MKHGARGNLLIVDDDPNAVRVLSAILSQDGYMVTESRDGKNALRLIPKVNPDLIVCDIKMPDMDGMQLFESLQNGYSNIPFVFLTGFGSIETAVRAMRSGAYHFFAKPPDYLKLKQVIDKGVASRRVAREPAIYPGENGHGLVVGTSPIMRGVLQIVDEVKDSVSSVLITGATGTGKEVIARTLHQRSCRRDKPFLAVNCAAIPHELMEAEFFGYEKGSFTGAISRRIGRFEEAAGGTLLLDEIGELSLPLQAKLLRVLQEREIQRIGSNKKIEVDFRLVSSTNRDLKSLVDAGTFREDLYYRINVIDIEMPALNQRKEDIPVLVNHFVRVFAERENKRISVPDEVIQMLMEHPWPGNIRQLKNAIERVVVLAKGGLITVREFTTEIKAAKQEASSRKQNLVPLRELEIDAVKNSLIVCNGNRSKAARLLGISRKAFYKRLNDLGITGKNDEVAKTNDFRILHMDREPPENGGKEMSKDEIWANAAISP